MNDESLIFTHKVNNYPNRFLYFSTLAINKVENLGFGFFGLQI